MVNLLYITIAFVLILCNAFFVAAEFAMVKLRHTRIREIKKHHGVTGKILAIIHQRLDAYLSACQLGVTLSSLGLGWLGEPAFANLLGPLLLKFHFSSIQVNIISFGVAFTIISFLHIVIGELMPKSLAIRHSVRLSLWTAIPLYMFYWLMYPAIWLLNICSNTLLKFIKLNPSVHTDENFYSTHEIKLILNSSYIHGELTKDEVDIMEHTLEFADLRITEVMRSADELVMLDIQAPLKESLELIIKKRFSRYPVYNSKYYNKVIGLVHVKDLFAALYQRKEIKTLKPFIRPILKVKHSTSAIGTLKQFRSGASHLGLVYRSTHLIGFVTLDNLLHVILGRIRDEFHRTENDWIKNP
ncbi:MAG: hemolysin family protein, partial [Burkholderiales bacterium]